jgi:KDO2-lipid IV(A) lauroyltransferase
VIDKNIDFCFPQKDSYEKKEIRNQFYLNFTDIVIESIKGLGTNRKSLMERFNLINPEILDPHFKANKSIVIYSQHYNNWEWGALTLGLQMSHHVIGIVKKISNGHINEYVQKGRTGANVSVVIMEEIKRLYNTSHDKPVAVVFIADQVPFRSTRNHEVLFLEKHIQFHKGAAIYACAKNTPVYSYDIHRIARGQYKVELTQLCLNPKEITPQELTQKYVKNLETLIQRSPSSWLWSHRRFKTEIDY